MVGDARHLRSTPEEFPNPGGSQRPRAKGCVREFNVFAERLLWGGERPERTWDPLKSVGPMRFGQSREEVSAALGEPIDAGDVEKYARWYPFYKVGIDTYDDPETGTPAAVAADACRGRR
ncbi:hypothetical protein [Streptomyces parvus]|uniref:hypothetical protein n=1 Tax=Streptomyces parvus TaxID=66428 RepID=UPI00363370AD